MAKPGTPVGGSSGGLTELKHRIFFVIGALVIFRLGAHIPVPGINAEALATLFAQTKGSIVDVFNMFSGGALSRLSLFALGVMLWGKYFNRSKAYLLLGIYALFLLFVGTQVHDDFIGGIGKPIGNFLTQIADWIGGWIKG